MIEGYHVTDIHVHIQPWDRLIPSAWATMADPRRDTDLEQLLAYQRSPPDFLAHLDDLGVDRVALINYVAPDVIGFDRSVNDWVADYCAHAPERLIPVGSVDVRHEATMRDVVDEVGRIAGLGIRMLKLHPAHQLVWPNAYRKDSPGFHGHPPDDKPYGDKLTALYDAATEHGLALMVHTGTSVFPNARNTMTDPLLVDDVAVDHPNLRIVLAHAGRPLWSDEAVFVARRHHNVWLDLSGIPPQHLVAHLPQLHKIAGKCLWGTDWPGPGLPDDALRRNVTTFLNADLGLDEDQRRGILHDNASRFLNLA